jgi:predicted nucleotidyltransferase
MKTDLDHLPANKQRELDRVKQIIFEEFEDALALGTMSWKKKGRIDKIILYGSYARGGWVDEPHTAKGYRSDFDLLIIVNDKRLTEKVDFWEKLEDRLIRELAIDKTLKTPVNFIVHTLQEVNDGLAHGRYFFMDVARDGIALYEYDDKPLHTPKPKTPEQALAMAREYFEEWYPSAIVYLNTSRDLIGQKRPKEAAFILHQSAERLYHCVLLVCTFYTPHVHNLAFLRTQAAPPPAHPVRPFLRRRGRPSSRFHFLPFESEIDGSRRLRCRCPDRHSRLVQLVAVRRSRMRKWLSPKSQLTR